MSKLSDKIKAALDESRILILGTQILLGFQYRAVFEQGFAGLPLASQYCVLVALGILLIGIALIMLPGAYHRIVAEGRDTPHVHDFTTMVVEIALVPLMLALGIDYYLISAKILGTVGGIVSGGVIVALALFFWYGLGFMSSYAQWDPGLPREKKQKVAAEMERTSVHDKVEQVLTEARVVLPGAQALLGFQFATILTETFDKLPVASKYVHMSSLMIMGMTVVFLMAPAAYHRIVERGEDTEHFHSVASRLLIVAMILLPLGLCGDLYVVVLVVTGSTVLAITSSVLALTLFYSLWFGFTVLRRRSLRVARG